MEFIWFSSFHVSLKRRLQSKWIIFRTVLCFCELSWAWIIIESNYGESVLNNVHLERRRPNKKFYMLMPYKEKYECHCLHLVIRIIILQTELKVVSIFRCILWIHCYELRFLSKVKTFGSWNFINEAKTIHMHVCVRAHLHLPLWV